MKKQPQNEGSFYIEAMVAIAMLSIIGTTLMPILPNLIKNTRQLQASATLVHIADYMGNYIYQWAHFDIDKKQVSLSVYNDGDELERKVDRRVQSLRFLDNTFKDNPNITDAHKVSMTFWETATRKDSAIIHTRVWIDENTNNKWDASESNISFSTIIGEKGTQFK